MRELLSLMVLLLTISAQAEVLDSTKFVAFYHYTIQTQDDEGQNVTDSMRMALLVGTRATYYTNIQSYNRDGRVDKEFLNAFMMHIQNVLTDMEKAKVTTLEAIYPYRYATNEPLAKIDWVITDDTMTVCGLLCHRVTGGLYGKEWSVWYTEEIPSPAGPWKLRGLPGLIVKAEDAEGIHCFELYETKNEVRAISAISNPNYQKLSRKKLMAFKKKTLGNPRYVKEPNYYVPEGSDTVVEVNKNGMTYYVGMDSHMIILQKSHVYQPLELE